MNPVIGKFPHIPDIHNVSKKIFKIASMKYASCHPGVISQVSEVVR